MTIELRPSWCLTEAAVENALDIGPWMIGDKPALERDGDDWQPGETVTVTRNIQLNLSPIDLRRGFGLEAGQGVGVVAKWSCRATSSAGVHAGGPDPIRLIENSNLTLEIPALIANSVELETSLIIDWHGGDQKGSKIPAGSVIWSDGWATPSHERSILLEGDQARIPVRSVSFKEKFGEKSSALWAIDLDTTVAFEDLLANVVTVLLNSDVTSRDFPGKDDEPDLSVIPDSVLCGINVDLVRSLMGSLLEELSSDDFASLEDLLDFEEGSVGRILGLHLITAFGSSNRAAEAYRIDVQTFDRKLWGLFAPKTWRSGR